MAVVVTRVMQNPAQFRLGLARNSATLAVPGAVEKVAAAREAAGGWREARAVGLPPDAARTYGGLGQTTDASRPAVPPWVLWLGGGAVAGALVGWLVATRK